MTERAEGQVEAVAAVQVEVIGVPKPKKGKGLGGAEIEAAFDGVKGEKERGSNPARPRWDIVPMDTTYEVGLRMPDGRFIKFTGVPSTTEANKAMKKLSARYGRHGERYFREEKQKTVAVATKGNRKGSSKKVAPRKQEKVEMPPLPANGGPEKIKGWAEKYEATGRSLTVSGIVKAGYAGKVSPEQVQKAIEVLFPKYGCTPNQALRWYAPKGAKVMQVES